MLQALGYGFLDKDGNQVPFGAKGLKVLEEITDTYVLPELKECKFKIACDVTNALCGEQGCSAVFGPQKGATPEMICQMDQWLGYYAALAKEKFPKADAKQEGTGAAGYLGFAFLTFTDAVLESGIKIVLEETQLEEYVKDADLVITGKVPDGWSDGNGKSSGWSGCTCKEIRQAGTCICRRSRKRCRENVMNMALMHFPYPAWCGYAGRGNEE